MDCAVCLQKCHHPTRLPCGHVFCFLCVKGVAIQNRKCALCRAPIPSDYLDNPVLLETLTPQSSEEITDEYQWYYEGRNGWWKYDERSNNELEVAFNSGAADCSLLLAGSLYRIDFPAMLQTRHHDANRKRRVRRDRPTLPAKGVAGIKMVIEHTEGSKDTSEDDIQQSHIESPPSETEPPVSETVGNDDESIPNQSESENSIQYVDIVESLRSLNLDNNAVETNLNHNNTEDS